MDIIITSSEAEGIGKTGGLGDYAAGLSESLSKIDEVNVKLIMPKYKKIKDIDLKLITKCTIPHSDNFEDYLFEFDVLYTKLNNVDVYLISNEYYFNRENIYTYDDEYLRWSFFSRAIMELITAMDWNPNIIHTNDSMEGILPLMYKKLNKNSPKFVLVIHSIYYQTQYDIDNKDLFNAYLGLKWDDNQISFMEQAIIYSDKVLTVGKSNAKDIQTTEKGWGFDKLLKSKHVEGILNGINKELYPRNYPFKSFLSIKKDYKNNIQQKFNLEVNNDIPLFVYVGRLYHQKGTDLFLDIMDNMMSEGFQFILLGTGTEDYEKLFIDLSKKYPNFILCNEFNEELSIELYKGGDILLMPSKCEPNGLSQIIAMNYATIPIVHNTGGLKDTIIDCFKNSEHGNGFKFYDFNSDEFYDTILNAVDIFKNKKEFWIKIMENDYKEDYGWDNQVKIYLKYYKSLLE